jgi:hypothetical protein
MDYDGFKGVEDLESKKKMPVIMEDAEGVVANPRLESILEVVAKKKLFADAEEKAAALMTSSTKKRKSHGENDENDLPNKASNKRPINASSFGVNYYGSGDGPTLSLSRGVLTPSTPLMNTIMMSGVTAEVKEILIENQEVINSEDEFTAAEEEWGEDDDLLDAACASVDP